MCSEENQVHDITSLFTIVIFALRYHTIGLLILGLSQICRKVKLRNGEVKEPIGTSIDSDQVQCGFSVYWITCRPNRELP